MKKSILMGSALVSVLILAGCNILGGTSSSKPHHYHHNTTVTSQSDVSTSTDTLDPSTSEDPTTNTDPSTSEVPTTSGNTSSSTHSSSSSSGKTSTGTSSSKTTSSSDTTPVVTSVKLNTNSASVKQGKTLTLTATVTGKNNPAKTLNWESSSSYATVSNGVVSISNSAPVGDKITITATSTVTPSVYDTCVITVLNAGTNESYTIMIYMCGSNLESDYANQDQGLASSDLLEILSVADKPDNVNIVVETGGSRRWSATPGVNANKLMRYHVENQTLQADDSLDKANMGLTSTLQSFISYGLTNYPADHTGFIYWDHGGAVAGCCNDDIYSDVLLASECLAAYKSTLSTTNKLDWVGYDCCIMSYADIAAINSDYFKYQVSSQELESGYGWDYDYWLPYLYEDTSIDTATLLGHICDGFVLDNGGFEDTQNDQCLSVLDLQNMATFTTAFESFAATLKNSDWNNIKSAYKSSLRMGNINQYGGVEYGYGLADMKNFLTEAKSKGYATDDALSALEGVTAVSRYGGYYSSTKPCGVNVFVPADDDGSPQITEEEYGVNDTKFTNWRKFVIANGSFYEDGGGWWY